MKILYLANIRLPTEKAHGVAIMHMCAALARNGATVRLVVARRFTTLVGDPFEVYSIPKLFSVVRIPVVDLFPLLWIRRSVVFLLESLTFYIALCIWLLPQSRRQIIYTRDIVAVLCGRMLGYCVVYECHVISNWRRLFFAIARLASLVVVISDALRVKFIQARFAPAHVLLAPSGVDVARFAIDTDRREARETLDIPQEVFVAAYTGAYTTMGSDKGLYSVLEALKDVPWAYFVAIGGAPLDLVRYGQQAQKLGVADRVSLRGYASQATLALIQRAANVLVAPFPDTPHYSRHMSPMKIIEYMAGKRPVITTDLPTIREVVSSDCSVIVPPDDPRAIAKALTQLRDNPAFGEQLARNAFNKIDHYSWDSRAQSILNAL